MGVNLNFNNGNSTFLRLRATSFRTALKKLSFSNLTLKKFYKKNNFSFNQPKLFLKHQILSGELRSINFFDKFLLNYFPLQTGAVLLQGAKTRLKGYPCFFILF